MKMRKLRIVSATVVMILGLLVVVPVHAADFTDWECKWFKGKEKNKGVFLTDNTENVTEVEKEVEQLPTYGFVQSYAGGLFTAWLVQEVDGGLNAIMFVAQVLGNNPDPLDYVVYALVDPLMGVPDVEALLVSLRIEGKEKKGELTKGKVQTVGGSVVYNFGGGDYFLAQESLKMKMIPQDKVPGEVIQALLAESACGIDCFADCNQE